MVTSVDTDDPSLSLSAPPFSAISIRPSGRKAMATGVVETALEDGFIESRRRDAGADR